MPLFFTGETPMPLFFTGETPMPLLWQITGAEKNWGGVQRHFTVLVGDISHTPDANQAVSDITSLAHSLVYKTLHHAPIDADLVSSLRFDGEAADGSGLCLLSQ